MPRKPKTQPAIDTADTGINQDAVSGAMVAMREQGVSQRDQEEMQLAQASQAIGGALMARLHKNFSHAAEVSMFMQIRDLPLAVLRRIPIPEFAATAANISDVPRGDGQEFAATAANLDDFCRRVFGRTATVLREETQNLSVLGEQAYEIAARLHIGRNALRVTRALPVEKLEIVRAAISTGSSKAEVLSVIEDLAEKVQTTEAQVTELQAEKEASDHLVEAKNKTIDKLQRQLKQIEKLPPDQAEALVLKEAADIQSETQGMVRGHLRQALIALQNLPEDQTLFMAGMVGQVMSDLVALRDEFNLPEVGGKPEWEKWAEKNSASTAGKAN